MAPKSRASPRRTRRRSSAAREDELDLVFAALSDRTRRSLLSRLQKSPLKISDLAAPYDISLPAVSKHVRVLERAGLVRRSIDGRVHECTLETAPLETADAWLQRHRVLWGSTLDALAAFVEEDDS